MNGISRRVGLCAGVLFSVLLLAGCVVTTDDPVIVTETIPTSTPTVSCPAPSGFGTFLNPWDMGTAPACDDYSTSTTQYYQVFLPLTGTWFFDLTGLTGDLDLYVTNVLDTAICSSTRAGTLSEDCDVLYTSTGYAYVRVQPFGGSSGFYVLDVY